MRINKHLFIFSSVLMLLMASYFIVLVKFFPILIHHTFYYCREIAKTISLSLPGNWGIIVFGIFIVSAVYTVFKLFATMIQVYKFRCLLSGSISNNHKFSGTFKALELTGKVVVLGNEKPFAYCFGLRKPKIYITTGLIAIVDRKELEIILRHEKYHLDHRDNLILFLATFVESLFPFFPIPSDLIRIYKTDRELLADQAAIRKESDKYTLSSILKKLLQYEFVTLPALAHAIADVDTLETRIKSLLSIKVNYPKPGKINVISSMVFGTLLIGLMGTPVHAVEFHRDGLDAMIVCSKNASCQSVCKDRSLIKLQSIQPAYTTKNFSTKD